MNRYRWAKDGKSFDISDQIVQKSDTGTLTFIKPSLGDEGEYVCYAENADGIARSNAVVLRRAFLDNFKNESVETIEVTEGDSLKLECKAPMGYPKPSLFWMIQTIHGAIRSVENSRVTLDPTGNLWFSSLTRDDASKDSFYVCSAASSVVNEYKLGNRIMLKVIPRSAKSLNGSPPSLQFVSPRDVLVLRGKKVEIFCIYDGVPTPSIAWSKDGKSIDLSERIILENFGKSLKIKNADVEDEGNYKCDVSSEIGEMKSSSFKLRVEAPPRFVTEPQARNISSKATAEIICEADGIPEPKVQWYFNGIQMKAGDNPRQEFGKSKIVLKGVQQSDTGNYVCYAENPHGSVSRNVYLNVLD